METVTINGQTYGPVASISVGGSPFTWTNPEACPVGVIITGGTITIIQFCVGFEGTGTFYTLGLLGGMFRLKPMDSIKVTYVLPPNMYYTPD